MALKLDLTTDYGITIPNAYIRIDGFEGNKTHTDLHVNAYNIVTEKKAEIQYVDTEVTYTDEMGITTTQMQSVPTEVLVDVQVKKLIQDMGRYTFYPQFNELNILEQGYIYLKTLPEYVMVTDC